ncbi:MAG TPA: hypothetical protein VHE57_01840 [Mycobacteriales bacterium]|nr:hypothetical protein [Mycobacteriales bacterium]
MAQSFIAMLDSAVVVAVAPALGDATAEAPATTPTTITRVNQDAVANRRGPVCMTSPYKLPADTIGNE